MKVGRPFSRNQARVSSLLRFWCWCSLIIIVYGIFPILELDSTAPTYISIHNQVDPSSYPPFTFKDGTGLRFWNGLKPGITCPSTLLARVGAKRDGGKWTCGLPNLRNRRPRCLLYSFGVQRDSSFEAAVLTRAHCEVFAYDPNVDHIMRPLKPSDPRVHFQKVGIDGQNTRVNDTGREFYTLKSLMQRNGNHSWIDILKIDAEGAEYPGLDKFMEDYPPGGEGNKDEGLPVGQLLVELHVHSWQHHDNGTGHPVGDEGTYKLLSFLRKLEARGLRMFSSEVNIHPAAKGTCAELAFINVKKLHKILH